jgi:hypothetical protein
MHTDVRHVRGHALDNTGTRVVNEFGFAGRIELQ